jgi:Flp pilus assembly protein TadG
MGRISRQRGWRRRTGGERGAVAVEFIILFPVLLLVLFAILDFGHAFYMKQMITNAAREGARYGVVYRSPKPTPAELQTMVQNVVTNYLASCGITPKGAPQVTFTTTSTDRQLTVVVTATKTWYVLSYILGPSTDIESGAVMRDENFP